MQLRHVRARTLIAALLAAGTLGLAACSDDDGGGEGGGSGEPIVFGIQTSVTGAIAALGVDQDCGIRAGVDVATNGSNEVAGRPIEFVVGDDQSDAGQAPRVARQMLQQDQPDIVFGFPTSSSALAAAPVMADAGVIDIYTIAAADELTAFSPTTFRTSRNATQEAQMGTAAAAIEEGDTFMIVAPDYAYGQSAARAWERLLNEQGGEQLGEIIYAPLDARDYTSAVERVRAEQPDILVVVTFAGTGGPRLFQAIDRANIVEDSRVITLLPQRPTREALGGIATEIEYFAIYDPLLPDNEINDRFVDRFVKLCDGTQPDVYAGDAAVAGMMAVKALEETGGDTDPQAVREALEGIEGESVKGAYRVRPEDHTFLFSFYGASLNESLEAELEEEFTMEDSEVPITKQVRER